MSNAVNFNRGYVLATGNNDRSFTEVHSRHVQDLGKDCAACHNFSRPERGLSLSQN